MNERVWIVLLLCLPSVVGSGFFLLGVLSEYVVAPTPPAISFSEPSVARRLAGGIGWATFLACYLGAAYRPLLIPLAGYQAVAVAREFGFRSSSTRIAWSAVLAALVSTAVFWGWLIHLDIFI